MWKSEVERILTGDEKIRKLGDCQARSMDRHATDGDKMRCKCICCCCCYHRTSERWQIQGDREQAGPEHDAKFTSRRDSSNDTGVLFVCHLCHL